jgi:phage gp46-like protein
MSIIDIKFTKNKEGIYDFDISDSGDFETDSTVENPLNASLFTNARADASEVPQAERRDGWWGNELYEVIGHQFGSKLHLLKQRRFNDETKNKAIDYIRKGLQWLIDDGIVTDINVSAILVYGNINTIQTEITLINNEKTEVLTLTI